MIRIARAEDLAIVAQVELASWPPGMASDEATLAARLAAFPAGQLIAEVGGKIIAYAGAQRTDSRRLNETPLSFATLTDRGRFTQSHNSQGDTYQLVGVGVLPAARGSHVARTIIDQQIAQARAIPEVRRIIGFTRPAKYHLHPSLTIEQYLALRNERGRLVDPVVGFHVNASAKIVSIHPAFRPEDHEALGYGVLIEYPRERVSGE